MFRFLPFFLWVLLSGLILPGCGSGNIGQQPRALREANLRVVHASPDAPNLDVVLDGARLLVNFPYSAYSAYYDLNSGVRDTRLSIFATNTNVLVTTTTLTAQTDTTLIIVGRLAELEILTLTDDNTRPASNASRLRFVQASSGLGRVDVYVLRDGESSRDRSPTWEGVAFPTATNYTTLPATDYSLQITTTGTKDVVLEVPRQRWEGGTVYTVVALGDSGAGKEPLARIMNDTDLLPTVPVTR